MTISKVAYVQVPSYVNLFRFLNKNDIDYSHHKDGADENEVWIEINNEVINTLSGEFLNNQESQQCAEENVEYIIFYE